MASYKKHNDGLWEYRIRYKDSNGKFREKSKKGFNSKPEARAAVRKIEEQLYNGINIEKQNTLVKDFLWYWFETFKKGTVEPNTEKNITNSIEFFVVEFGNYKLKDVDSASVQKYINKVAKDYTKSTLQSYIGRIREAFYSAIDQDYIHKSPVRKVIYPKTVKPIKNKVKNVELEEYMQLIKAMDIEWSETYIHYKFITLLSVATGARIGEICALTINDLDIPNKTLNINKTYVRVDGIWRVKDTTKTGESGERIIGIDDYTTSKMEEWLKLRKKILFKTGKKSKQLFVNELGDFVKPVNYGSNLRKICVRNKLKHITPHMFRHTHTTIMWEAGISDINFIGDRLGDKDKEILANTYSHKSKHSEQTNTEKVNQIMQRWNKSVNT